MKVNKKQRNSMIELLRIISMILIVLSHYSSKSGVDIQTLPLLSRYFFELTILGNLGVDIFVLITGYYGLKQPFSLNRIVKFVLEVFFYSISIYLIVNIFSGGNIKIIELIKSCLPLTFNIYWFATVYFVLLLIQPFLNKFLNSITQQYHLLFIVVLFTIFSLLKTITTMEFYGNELTIFILLYSMGAYIQRTNKTVSKKNVLYIIFISLFLILSTIILDYICINKNLNIKYLRYFFSKESLFIILLSINIFLLFTKKVFSNKIMNYITPSIFSIYLIHENPYIRSFLWDLLRVKQYSESGWVLILNCLFSIAFIFIISLLIDIIRRELFEKHFLKLISKPVTNLEKRIKELLDESKKALNKGV